MTKKQNKTNPIKLWAIVHPENGGSTLYMPARTAEDAQVTIQTHMATTAPLKDWSNGWEISPYVPPHEMMAGYAIGLSSVLNHMYGVDEYRVAWQQGSRNLMVFRNGTAFYSNEIDVLDLQPVDMTKIMGRLSEVMKALTAES